MQSSERCVLLGPPGKHWRWRRAPLTLLPDCVELLCGFGSTSRPRFSEYRPSKDLVCTYSLEASGSSSGEW